MLKRVFVFIAACFIMLAAPFSVFADILYEPRDDFYIRNRKDCEDLRLNFTANGADGYVSVKREPGSDREIIAVENGEMFRIYLVYNNQGESWGLCDRVMPTFSDEEGWNWYTGWAKMEELLLVYDYLAFEKEHENEFYGYDGSYDKVTNAEKNVMWTYPGSGVVAGIHSEKIDEDYLNWYNPQTYRDAEGREWIYLRRLPQGDVFNIWICVSDPENEDIPAIDQPRENPLTGDMFAAPSPGLSLPRVVIIMVTALLIGTAVLIRLFWKPNKKA